MAREVRVKLAWDGAEYHLEELVGAPEIAFKRIAPGCVRVGFAEAWGPGVENVSGLPETGPDFMRTNVVAFLDDRRIVEVAHYYGTPAMPGLHREDGPIAFALREGV